MEPSANPLTILPAEVTTVDGGNPAAAFIAAALPTVPKVFPALSITAKLAPKSKSLRQVHLQDDGLDHDLRRLNVDFGDHAIQLLQHVLIVLNDENFAAGQNISAAAAAATAAATAATAAAAAATAAAATAAATPPPTLPLERPVWLSGDARDLALRALQIARSSFITSLLLT